MRLRLIHNAVKLWQRKTPCWKSCRNGATHVRTSRGLSTIDIGNVEALASDDTDSCCDVSAVPSESIPWFIRAQWVLRPIQSASANDRRIQWSVSRQTGIQLSKSCCSSEAAVDSRRLITWGVLHHHHQPYQLHQLQQQTPSSLWYVSPSCAVVE